MDHSPDRNRAALLLTNRLVSLPVDPLTAREFWYLTNRVDLGDLIHPDVDGITALLGIAEQEALRLRTLLEAVTALSFEEERLLEGGVSLISALDERFPTVLRERLGTTCPPFLLAAGPLEWAGQLGLGVVGSRDTSKAALNAARESAEMAVRHKWPVISGLARGVDQVAMAAALEVNGAVIGVPADGIITASRNAEIRRRVHQGELCILSPYAPTAPFRAGNAMGRNKIVYALSQVTFVVASDKDTGGTWAGAKEALDRRCTAVAVWAGNDAQDGNHALISRGAHPITDLAELFTLDPTVTTAQPPSDAQLQTQLF
jgi:predicted Rossmann fold nucleotide-binding protein DprA/Smf involved in DNA uptake